MPLDFQILELPKLIELHYSDIITESKCCCAVFPFSLSQEVEPMAKESDHIHIIGLTDALGVCVRIEYMDRGGDSSVNHHDFPEDGTKPCVYLIYRPGHYDILYRKEL